MGCYVQHSIENNTVGTYKYSIGKMNTPNLNLEDGEELRIFVIGGWNERNLQECEVYNVNNETWTTIASTEEPRLRSSAVVQDYRIFVAGGQTDGSPLSSIEIYDPFENKWSMCGSMSRTLFSHCMASLNGSIYVAGRYGKFFSK